MSNKRKRKKRRLKKSFKIIIPIIIILIVGIFIFFNYRLFAYNLKNISVFRENDIINIIRDNKYSKTLDEVIINDKFNKEYLDDYLNINYINNDNFIDNINLLLKLGYSSKDINVFYDKLPNSIDVITDNIYDKDIVNYVKLNYFYEDYLDRYIKYGTTFNDIVSVYDITGIKDNYNYEDTVTFVNANLDKEYYKNDIKLSDEQQESIDALVNKYYKVSNDYEPSDLVVVNSKFASGTQKLRKEAASKFEEMCEAAFDDGYKIYAGSTYRSYEYQKGLYNRYVASDGFDAAETFSARAGYSEHQLGLAIDIVSSKWDYLSENDSEYKWLIDNSYKYGFILRYPRGKEYITGYEFEDWHFRYLGEELATLVYKSGLTYDEYVARNKKGLK